MEMCNIPFESQSIAHSGGKVTLWLADVRDRMEQLDDWADHWGPCPETPERRRVKKTAGRMLDLMIQKFLRAAPEAIMIRRGNDGKPFIPGAALDFNLSHSGDFVALAIVECGCVGVDIECVRPDRSHLAIARRYFAPSEYQNLASESSKSRRMEEFYRLWTMKEATLKAAGRGIAHGLDTIIPSPANNPIVEIHLSPESTPYSSCQPPAILHATKFQSPPGYHGAVAWNFCPAPQKTPI